ncbi:MAG: cob(I)yrinic acid a,c-diamide adenosyltransferase [Desulfovibrio sp.]|jgi:cob(I)alamin adenosyltransferase|nr:cob(I)yrinic acid a,c-diamide adenosyltransferase [Desulfovibrio sp.]
MILLYTGDGKGKTSACVGQAVRAHGRGLRVVFAQFMKRAGCAGEQKLLAALDGIRFFAGGAGFFRNEVEREEHRRAALTVFSWARENLPEADVLILDESIYALGSGLLLESELRELMDMARAKNIHLVLSGRGAPDWIVRDADLVTEMRMIKHPMEQGEDAVKGIEF